MIGRTELLAYLMYSWSF